MVPTLTVLEPQASNIMKYTYFHGFSTLGTLLGCFRGLLKPLGVSWGAHGVLLGVSWDGLGAS